MTGHALHLDVEQQRQAEDHNITETVCQFFLQEHACPATAPAPRRA